MAKRARRRDWVSCPWDPSDESQERAILALNRANDYGPKEGAPAYFDWQYRRNPAGKAIIRLAVDKGDREKLAGIYVAIPVFLQCHGETVPAALSINTLTDINYRGQGIFTGLAREVYDLCAERGLHAVIGYPNPNSYRGFVKHLNFRDICDIPLVLRILRFSEIVKKRFPIQGLVPFAGAISRVCDPWFRRHGTTDRGVHLVREFDQAFNGFNNHLGHRFSIYFSRDTGFLNWRYLDHPFRYRVLAVRANGKILGYLVYRQTRFAKMNCGMILDFLVRADVKSGEIGGRLIQRALHEMMTQDCDIAGALCLPHTMEFGLLRRAGFFRCPSRFRPQPFPCVVRRNHTPYEFRSDIFNITNWLVAIGDYDAA